MSNLASHWLVSYASALTLYWDLRGLIHPRSLDVPCHLLVSLAECYLAKLATLHPYFRDVYFVHEFRGWKGATVHNPANDNNAHQALAELTACLNMDSINPDQ